MLHLPAQSLWERGYAISVYSTDFNPIEGQSFSELGSAIHRYKYWNSLTAEDRIRIETYCTTQVRGFLERRFGSPLPFSHLIAVPPNRPDTSSLPPAVARMLAMDQGMKLIDASSYVIKKKVIPSLKTLKTYEEKVAALSGAYEFDSINYHPIQGFLLIDDIFDSGVTLRFLARAVKEVYPKVPRYVLALTALKKNY